MNARQRKRLREENRSEYIEEMVKERAKDLAQTPEAFLWWLDEQQIHISEVDITTTRGHTVPLEYALLHTVLHYEKDKPIRVLDIIDQIEKWLVAQPALKKEMTEVFDTPEEYVP